MTVMNKISLTVMLLLIWSGSACCSKDDAKFDFSGAQGVLLKSKTTTMAATYHYDGVNLFRAAMADSETEMASISKIVESGDLENAVVEGEVDADYFVVNGDKIYFYTEAATTLDGDSCFIFTVDVTDNSTHCIYSDSVSVYYPGAGNESVLFKFDPFQVDDEGSVYFISKDEDQRSHLIKVSNDGTKTELAVVRYGSEMDGMFAVAGDGSVFISGFISGEYSTTGEYKAWTKRIPSGETLSDIETDGETVFDDKSQWLKVFPDGNVYFAVHGSEYGGIYRYITSESKLDDKAWLIEDGFDDAYHYSCADVAGVSTPSSSEPNPDCGVFVTDIFVASDDHVYVLDKTNDGSGDDGYMGDVLQIYPTIEYVESSVVTVKTASDFNGDSLIVSGYNVDGELSTVIYDKTDDSEVSVLTSDDNIRVEFVGASSDGESVIFTGVDLDDDSEVFGTISVSDGTVTTQSLDANDVINFSLF